MASVPETTPRDYCVTCGLHYGEYLACEDGGCLLKSEQDARDAAADREVARILAMSDDEIMQEAANGKRS